MEENKQDQVDDHLLVPPKANIGNDNSPEAEEKTSKKNIEIDKSNSGRQKQWQQEIKEGDLEKQSTDRNKTSTMPMDNDDTLGIP